LTETVLAVTAAAVTFSFFSLHWLHPLAQFNAEGGMLEKKK